MCARASHRPADHGRAIGIAPAGARGWRTCDGSRCRKSRNGEALNTGSNFSIEEVAEASDGPKWFQSYVFRDRGITTDPWTAFRVRLPCCPKLWKR
ncbi:MAG: alpha-hydroxy-acid oxidizing protein [Rhodoglobus sp.]